MKTSPEEIRAHLISLVEQHELVAFPTLVDLRRLGEENLIKQMNRVPTSDEDTGLRAWAREIGFTVHARRRMWRPSMPREDMPAILAALEQQEREFLATEPKKPAKRQLTHDEVRGMMEGKSIRMLYAGRDSKAWRTVLVSYVSPSDLTGFCLLRGEDRTFRRDRIVEWDFVELDAAQSVQVSVEELVHSERSDFAEGVISPPVEVDFWRPPLPSFSGPNSTTMSFTMRLDLPQSEEVDLVDEILEQCASGLRRATVDHERDVLAWAIGRSREGKTISGWVAFDSQADPWFLYDLFYRETQRWARVLRGVKGLVVTDLAGEDDTCAEDLDEDHDVEGRVLVGERDERDPYGLDESLGEGGFEDDFLGDWPEPALVRSRAR